MSIALPRTVHQSLAILRAGRVVAGRPKEEAWTMEERIRRVIEIFDQVGARWTLVGAHAVGALTEPRATVDFDFIVEASRVQAIIEALTRELGELDVADMGPALRLRALDVDLIRSDTHPLFAEALRRTRSLEGWTMPIPEVLIVLKFLAATSTWRGATKKTYDVADLRALVQAVGLDRLDRDLMTRLAAQVYPGAEAEFEKLLGRIERGDPLTI